MLRLNRIKVCETLQGAFRFKHVSEILSSSSASRNDKSICRCNVMMTNKSFHFSRLRALLRFVARINQSGELLSFIYCATDNQLSVIRERRAPFSPAIVKRLIKHGVKVIVQPSNRRAYPMQVRNCLLVRRRNSH